LLADAHDERFTFAPDSLRWFSRARQTAFRNGSLLATIAPMDLADLTRRAIEYARRGDFGADALAANMQIATLAPQDENAWSRLGRCYAELQQFGAAEEALRLALALNPTNTVARNLLADVLRRRQFVPTTGTAHGSGFRLSDFDALGRAPSSEATDVIAPKLKALLLSLNERTVAEKVVIARNRLGRDGTTLFHRDSFYWHRGHVYAFHYGGRWEPQFNIGLFSAHQWPSNWLRAGIGFHLSLAGRDPDPEEGQRRALAYFAAFQRALARRRRDLIDWMQSHSGALQHGVSAPSDSTAERQIEWLTRVANPANEEWIFLGRWFYLDRPRDREIVTDFTLLTRAIDEVFRELLPVWMDAWTNADV
jgi:tetratricopeptide (TPR) repeat protein